MSYKECLEIINTHPYYQTQEGRQYLSGVLKDYMEKDGDRKNEWLARVEDVKKLNARENKDSKIEKNI